MKEDQLLRVKDPLLQSPKTEYNIEMANGLSLYVYLSIMNRDFCSYLNLVFSIRKKPKKEKKMQKENTTPVAGQTIVVTS